MEELFSCYLVLRSAQQGYHGIIGVAVAGIAGGGDEVGNRPSPSLKSDSLSDTGKWERGKFCSREVAQAADGSMRVGQPAYVKSLGFVPLGKLRKEQSGDASEVESCHEIGAWSSWCT